MGGIGENMVTHLSRCNSRGAECLLNNQPIFQEDTSGPAINHSLIYLRMNRLAPPKDASSDPAETKPT